MSAKSSIESKSLYNNSDSDDCILKDFRPDKKPFNCDTCSAGFKNLKAYEDHMNGKKHNKMVNALKAKAKAVELDASKDNSNISSNEEETEEIECDVCKIKVNGHVPYYSHMKSKKHAKNVKKLKLRDRMKDMPEVLKNDANKSDEEDDLVPKPIARCDPCQKMFYCPESFHQHMQSLLHKKKAQYKALADNISQNKVSENGESEYYCEVCDKNFSGPVPYTCHMRSPIHAKEVSKAKHAAEVKHLCKETGDKHSFVCKECDKSFNNPLALLEHVNSNDHEKQKAKEELKQFIAQYPEISLAKEVISNADSDDEEDILILLCKLCKVSLAGPEPAKQHINSNKHKAMKKKKEIAKQIKLQQVQKNDNDKYKMAKKETDQPSGSGKIVSPQESTNENEDTDDFEVI